MFENARTVLFGKSYPKPYQDPIRMWEALNYGCLGVVLWLLLRFTGLIVPVAPFILIGGAIAMRATVHLPTERPCVFAFSVLVAPAMWVINAFALPKFALVVDYLLSSYLGYWFFSGLVRAYHPWIVGVTLCLLPISGVLCVVYSRKKRRPRKLQKRKLYLKKPVH